MTPGPNWAQSQPGQTPNSAAMFQFMSQPPRYPALGMQGQHLNGERQQHMFRMMAPPPVPQQKQGMQNGSMPPNHPFMMVNRPSFSPQHNGMMHANSSNEDIPGGIRPQMNSQAAEKAPVNLVKQPYNSFSDPQPSLSGSAGQPGLTPGTSHNLNLNNSIVPDTLQLGVSNVMDAESKALEARLHEILNPQQSSPWPSEQKPVLSNDLNMFNPSNKALPLNSAERGSQPSLRSPSIPNDLKNVMPSMFTSDMSNPHTSQTVSKPTQIPRQQQHHQTLHQLTPAVNNLPSMDQVSSLQQPLPSMSLPIGQIPSQTSLFNMAQNQGMFDEGSLSGSDKDKPKRRRRKRCGTCTPCQQKQDCGECYVCRNKGQVNAICKLRKCMLLRKKVNSAACFIVCN